VQAGRTVAGAPAVAAGDIAAHHEKAEPGPHPFVRGVLGLLLGAATGALILVLTSRPKPTVAVAPAAGAGGRGR
jgi:hypothetical protein